MNPLDQRPLVLALAGPNGAGKSTFYEAHLRRSGMRFVNADELARELGVDPYRAAEAASQVRRDLVAAGESFIFETVFSDPQQDKINFLLDCQARGYTVVLCFIGLLAASLSDERVALRALMGGHDVPREKLLARYPRSLANLALAMDKLPHVSVFDNSVDDRPHRLVARLEQGQVRELALPVPDWVRLALASHLPGARSLLVHEVAREGERVVLELAPEQGSPFRIRYRTRQPAPKIGEQVHFGTRLELLDGPPP